MKVETSFIKRFKIDLILIFVLLLVVVAILLHHYPVTVEVEDTDGKAAMPPQMGYSDTLLILPSTNSVADNFESFDFSFAWYNILAQEFGTFNIELSSNVNVSSLSRANFIVIPARCTESFTDAQIQAVQQRVQNGATLILEMPTPAWEPLTAVKRKVNASTAIKRFTDAPNSPLNNEQRELLLNMPLDTRVLRIDTLDSDTLGKSDLLLEIDGAIAHYHRAVGNGHIFVIAFDLGRAITAIQQGKPNDNLTISTENEYPTPADLVLNEKLKTSLIPYADLLKKHVIRSALRYTPHPILWPYPDAFAGALIITHEENQFGDNAYFMAEHEHGQNMTSTYFITSQGMSNEMLRTMSNQHFDIGLQAEPSPKASTYARRGPAFFKPSQKALKIFQQRKHLERLSKSSVNACKVKDSIWNVGYTETFRKLVYAKCQIDASYSPTEPNTYGFLFGTAFPFLPIDRQGLPLPVYEFPTILTDSVNVREIPEGTAVNLLKDSNNHLNIPLVYNFDADSLATHPYYDSLSVWLSVLEQAPKENHWVTNLTAFMHFYSLRRQSQMSYTYNATLQSIDISLHLPDAPRAYTLALPQRNMGSEISSIQTDSVVIDKNFIITKDGFFNLIKVLPGEHKIRVQWGTP